MKVLITCLLSVLVLFGCTQETETKHLGEGEGYAGSIQVEVTKLGTKITSIQVLDSSDTPGLSTQAFEVIIQRVIEKQSTDVDVVAGATKSSRGLLEAIDDALSN